MRSQVTRIVITASKRKIRLPKMAGKASLPLHGLAHPTQQTPPYYRHFYHSVPVGCCSIDAQGRILEANQTLAVKLRARRKSLIGLDFSSLLCAEDMDSYRQFIRQVLASSEPSSCNLRLTRMEVVEGVSARRLLWTHLEAAAAQGESCEPLIHMVLYETNRSQIVDSQNACDLRMLDLLATDLPISKALGGVLECLTAVYPDMRGSVLLKGPHGDHLTLVASRNQPQGYDRQLYGLEVGPNTTWYGAAAFGRRSVFLANIASDFRWHAFGQLTLAAGLQSCWTTPIIGRGGAAIGVLSIAFDYPRRALQWELEYLEMTALLLAPAIERRELEGNLRNANLRLKNVLEASHLATWEWNVQTGETVFNEDWADMLGYTLAELPPISIRTWEALCHPDDLKVSGDLLMRHFAGEFPYYDCECRMKHKDGHWVWMHDRGRLLSRTGDGRPLMMFGTHAEISERKKMEAAVANSEKLLQSCQCLAKIGAWEVVMPESRVTWTEETYRIHDLKAVDFPPNSLELIARSFACYRPEDQPVLMAAFQRCLESGEPYDLEFPFTTAMGRKLWVRTMAEAVLENGQVTRISGNIIDITERRKREEDLRISEARFRTLFEVLPVGATLTNPSGHILMTNPASEALLGIPTDELLRRDFQGPYWGIIRPDGSPMPPEEYASVRALQESRIVQNVEMGVCRPDGRTSWIDVSATPIDDPDMGVLIVYSDITAHKDSQALQRKSLEQLEKIAAMVPGVIYQFRLRPDGSSCFPFASAAIRDIYRVSPEEAAKDASGVFAVLHPEDLARVSASIQQSAMTLEPWSCEYRVRFEDGTIRTLLGNAQPQQEEDGSVLWNGFITDITDRQRQAAQLSQLQKMQGLGTLASGVAHDMNNVLGAILGLASVQVEVQVPGSSAYRAFETITRACERGGALIRSLLGFARQRLAEDKELELNALVQDQVMLMERTTEARIRVVKDLAEDLHPMRGDASALAHLLLNLSLNALDAMPNTGSLRFRTRNVDAQWIELLVEDTGCGMNAEVLAKAMDPFYTTKEQGKGTGLGLSLTHSTVIAHQGQIQLESEPGLGTRVRLRFPACEAVPRRSKAREATHAGPDTPGTRLRVLLVDDDELVQNSTQTILEALGHEVDTVSSGEEALAKLEAGLQADLVILDMNMPGLGGAGTLPRLRGLRPALPVIIATGRSDQNAMSLAASQTRVTLLTKPFDMKMLKQRLESLAWV